VAFFAVLTASVAWGLVPRLGLAERAGVIKR
jgi:hypothetical protein